MSRCLSVFVRGSLLAAMLAAVPVSVHAQDAMATTGTRTESGSLAADSGGSNNYWTVMLPAGKDVTFNLSQTNFPCLAGPGPKDKGNFGMSITQGARTNYSVEIGTGGCQQRLIFNSPDGGSATVEVYSYVPGFSASYSLEMVGVVDEAEPVGTVPPPVDGTPVVPEGPPTTGRVR